MKHSLTLAMAVLFALSHFEFPSQRELEPAMVTGMVTDRLNSRIARAEVEFRSSGQERVAVTAGDGSYQISLKPGTYEVAARATSFCSGRHGAIILHENVRAQIDFQLVDCGIIDSIEAPPLATEPRVQIKPPGPHGNGYGEEELSPVPVTGLRPLVLFGRRTQNDDVISYSGLQHKETRLPVVFTYDLMTLRATTIVFHSKDNSIDGSGNVVWQDGTDTWHGRRIKISVSEDPPRVLLKE